MVALQSVEDRVIPRERAAPDVDVHIVGLSRGWRCGICDEQREHRAAREDNLVSQVTERARDLEEIVDGRRRPHAAPDNDTSSVNSFFAASRSRDRPPRIASIRASALYIDGSERAATWAFLYSGENDSPRTGPSG